MISFADLLRSLNGLSGKNTTPLFGVLVNCSGFRPGNATSWPTPSMLRAAAATFFSAASVRSIDAPSGIFTPAIRYSLSCVG